MIKYIQKIVILDMSIKYFNPSSSKPAANILTIGFVKSINNIIRIVDITKNITIKFPLNFAAFSSDSFSVIFDKERRDVAYCRNHDRLCGVIGDFAA